MRHFEDFALDERTGELYRAGERLHVTGKAVDLLRVLSERPGELMTRQELRERLWPDNTFVDFDNNLNVAVRRLRQVLDDSATAPRFVETLPRRGLRFIPALVPPLATPAPGRPARPGRGLTLAGLLTAAALTGVGDHAARLDPDRPPAIAIQGFRNLSGVASDDYVSEGLRAELTVALAARDRPAIQVVADGESSAPFVVRGTSRRDASGLYVTAELVDRRTNAYVWGESYVCPREDLFAIQRQVAAKIGERVTAALGPPSGRR